MTMSIRAATHEDIPRMVEIEEASFSDPWSAASFSGFLSDANAGRALVTVAEEDGSVVGYSVMLFAIPDADLANIAVEPTKRGKGIGRLLLERCLAAAKTIGTKNVFLEVRASNADAIRMYEAAGFGPLGMRRRYYRDPVEDARVLRLDLSSR